MKTQKQIEVAILLPTYNGAEFIEAQIGSLRENATSFTLHWLDDDSTDNTREVFRASARSSGIQLMEWHPVQHQGYPCAFFQLMECVDADIYLFCDQDDIWQPGKIDATVTSLLAAGPAPLLCFSAARILAATGSEAPRRVLDLLGVDIEAALQEPRSLMFCPAQGNTMGFTRSLREIFLRHKDIARAYSPAHDWWMYLIAVASGTARMLHDVPTTLFRLHGSNVSGFYYSRNRWRRQQAIRPLMARQAEGFCLATSTMTPGTKLDRLIAIAQRVATMDRRQSLAALFQLARSGAMPPSMEFSAWLIAACLCSDAKAGPRYEDSKSMSPVSE